MKSSQFQEHAIKAMVAMNTAVQNLRLYPADNPSTLNAIEDACRSILEVFHHGDPLVFSREDGNLAICDETIHANGQHELTIESFMELMNYIGIHKITFTKDLEEDEIKDFLDAVTTKPEDMMDEGGLQKIMASKNFRHIHLNYKTEEIEKETQEIPETEVKKINLTKSFSPMVQILDHVLADNRKDPVAMHLAASMTGMDLNVLITLITQKMESEFGEKLFNHFFNEIEDEPLEKIILKMQHLAETGQKDSDRMLSPDADLIKEAFQKVITTEKGQGIYQEIKLRQEEERAKKEKQLAELKAAIARIIKGDMDALKDDQIMRQLPVTVLQMVANNNEAVWAIIDGLGAGLVKEDKEARSRASKTLLAIADDLPSNKHLEILEKVSDPLTGWLKLEESSSPGYEKICEYTLELAHYHIQKRQLNEYRSILETFNSIKDQKAPRDEAAQLLAVAALNSITTEDIITSLAEELQSSEKETCDQAVEILTQLGGDSVDALLQLLEQSHSRSTRAKILLVLTDIGSDALPAIKEKILETKPWYYQRNLAKLIGKIGDEDCLNLLRPLLMNTEYRVQREALDSIFAIGDERRTEILLSVMLTADDRLKVDIIGMLGALEWDMAESVFLEMIESKTIVMSKAGDDLLEKMCHVLGNIGTQKSVPILNSILEQKRSLIGKNPYGEKVRIAAERALARITEIGSSEPG